MVLCDLCATLGVTLWLNRVHMLKNSNSGPEGLEVMFKNVQTEVD